MNEQAQIPENFVQLYQGWVEQSAWYGHAGTRSTQELAYIAMGVSGEAGEFIDQLKKIIRPYGVDVDWKTVEDEDKLKMVKELGDVLWYVSQACTFFNIPIEALMLINTVKLYERLQGKWKDQAEGRDQWPLEGLSYEDAKRLVQHIETLISGKTIGRVS